MAGQTSSSRPRRSNNALIGFAMVFATLLANGLLSYLNVRRLYVMQQSVARTHDVLFQLDALLTTLVHAETGQRGFHATGDPSYLEPYQYAIKSAPAQLQKIDKLVTNEPLQRSNAGTLRAEVGLTLEALGEKITRPPSEDKQGPATAGERQMVTVREIVSRMQDEERRQLARSAAESETSYWTALVTSLIAAILGFALAAVAYALVERDMERRARAENELKAANELLELRVKERTAAISEMNAALREEIDVRQEAEKQVNRFAEELQRSNRELTQFASVASHDLHEPLRKIQAFGDRLRTQYGQLLGGDSDDYLERMLSAAGRMRKLIDDLLAYSRVSIKAQPFETVDLQQVAEEAVADLDERLRQTGGRIDINDLPTIMADVSQMHQLLQNLFSNALKFHRPGISPIVTVSGRMIASRLSNGPLPRKDSGPAVQCELRVADNGIGFDPSNAQRIFELFERLHGRDAYEGTGMGLAICKKIVERHGGAIFASGSPGQGAEFVVTLPVQQPVLADQA